MFSTRQVRFPVLLTALALGLFATTETARGAGKRVLLLWQSPDGHPATTHEYETGIRVTANWLQQNTPHQVVVSQADSPWTDGPDRLTEADAVVMFVSQGAKWLREEPRRREAFQELAQREGGFAVLHWGMGTKQAEDIADFVQLFGACHGGPDRKYKFLTTALRVADSAHPIQRGLSGLDAIEDEFYYALKTLALPQKVVPLMEARIDDEWQMVSWAWERPAGGRSFGFSGLHFHRNWTEETYRRLVFQGIAWTLGDEIPERGLKVEIESNWLKLPERDTVEK